MRKKSPYHASSDGDTWRLSEKKTVTEYHVSASLLLRRRRRCRCFATLRTNNGCFDEFLLDHNVQLLFVSVHRKFQLSLGPLKWGEGSYFVVFRSEFISFRFPAAARHLRFPPGRSFTDETRVCPKRAQKCAPPGREREHTRDTHRNPEVNELWRRWFAYLPVARAADFCASSSTNTDG